MTLQNKLQLLRCEILSTKAKIEHREKVPDAVILQRIDEAKKEVVLSQTQYNARSRKIKALQKWLNYSVEELKHRLAELQAIYTLAEKTGVF